MAEIRFSHEVHSGQKRVVLTNGVFDGLHAGHVRMLRSVRWLHPSMPLVVAVNSDTSVEEIKGRPPRYSENHRAEVVLNVGSVSEVCIWDGNVERLFSELDIGVYVKSWKAFEECNGILSGYDPRVPLLLTPDIRDENGRSLSCTSREGNE